jgi:bacterioferritin (cytochrome b1)
MRKVGAMHRSRIIGLLAARLSFERASGRLYDSVLHRLRSRGGPYQMVLAHLRRIREEEREHEEWLDEQLHLLGEGLHVDEGVRGGEEPRMDAVLRGDPEPAQLLRLLLEAEVADAGGWELLLEIAARAQDDEAREAFEQRLHEEQEHFRLLCHMAAVLTGNDIIDETVTALEDASA